MTTTISALIERLEGLSGPDRAVDVEIAVWKSGFSIDHFRDVINQIGVPGSGWTPQEKEWPRYTGSIDAALTLVPEGWQWQVSNRAPAPHSGRAYINNKQLINTDTAATPAIVICIVSLRARAAIGED